MSCFSYPAFAIKLAMAVLMTKAVLFSVQLGDLSHATHKALDIILKL